MRASERPAAATSSEPSTGRTSTDRARLASALGGLCLVFAVLAAADLANVRPVSGDDALILTLSAHFAETGQFGSPLYDGVHGADEHYFLNLPLQHLLHAAAFRLIGEGVVQARAVSVLAALVLLCASTLLARRWLGARVALITAVLLVVWRSGLIGLDYGLPLLAVARTARYDVTAVALLWLALLIFDMHLRRPRRALAFATGVLAALAMLTQFHGALVLPALAALWLARSGGLRDVRAVGLPWLLAGLLLTLTPYAVWFTAHGSDALAQLRLVHGARAPGGMVAVLRSAVTEPLRFSEAALQRGIGQVGLLVAFVVAPLLIRRASAAGPVEDECLRAPLFVGLAMVAGLAFFEPTKAPLYALPLLPIFCMLLAAALEALHEFGRRGTGFRSRSATAAAFVLAFALAAEGIMALARDRAAAAGVTPYAALAERIDYAMEDGARVLGPAQWSWGLRAHPYDELRATSLRHTVLEDAGATEPSLERVLRERRVRYILLNEDIGGELLRGFYGPGFSVQLSRLLASCTAQVRVWNDPTYGVLDLRSVAPACAGD